MPWKCPQDGNDVSDELLACPHCLYVRMPTGVSLASDATGKKIEAHIETLFGALSLRRLQDPDVKFVSNDQFHLKCWVDKGGWAVVPVAYATNPSFLNGEPIDPNGALLKAGDKLSIKGKYFHLTVGLL